MSSLARYRPSTNSNHPCPDLMTMAERELSAFFKAVTQIFGYEQAKLSGEDWLQTLVEIDALPTSAREWRLITSKASTRLASRIRMSASSLSSSLSSSRSSSLSSSLSTESQIA